MRVAVAASGDPWVQAPGSKPRQALALLRSTASWWLSKPQKSPNSFTHSVAALPSRFDRYLNTFDAQVLHLHWVQDEFISVEAIGRLRKPLVWTLHDSWPFCGSEHHPDGADDRRFRQGYRADNRPIDHGGCDLDRWTWCRKRRAWSRLLPRLQLVAPSRWMAEQVASSALFSGVPCHVIPNAVPDAFRPLPRHLARELLGWPQHKPLLLFGAISGTSDFNKGFDLLQAALNGLSGLESSPLVVVLGSQLAPSGLNWPVLPVARLHDDVSLALAYSAADVVIVPSRLDNLPQIATEAQACGTPVVAFRQGGMVDAVRHGISGYLADPFDVADLAQGIQHVLLGRLAFWDFSKDQRLIRWRSRAVAQAHVELYREIAGNVGVS
jgi:glycosyltransferase involved in cell wall biosynthesis